MSEPLINKVAESGLVTLDLEQYYPKGETAVFDLKDYLFMGMILKEKDYREGLKTTDWSVYSGKNVALTCSADAIIPVWAWMLAAAYLQPVVHEIKVSWADLLGDLRLRDKRDSYLDIGGQCWYVLGCDARGRPIAQADEVPPACGVIFAMPDGQLDVARHAPSRAIADLPFALWMALSRATPLSMAGVTDEDGGPGQAMLQPQTAPAADLP